ncbi:hypothetical protein BJ508DRAFT_314308 [Ascobolus immersus RN42]|uniref:Uncharacterized protein n=1 Tax=Ascobolus immersus RN42 TaxID=1160509 RepID=A0A3N4HLG5_ASCIM|nr:hypothetical protein BJ508DRAFT_314308 [Ascobolus immersus RN42]
MSRFLDLEATEERQSYLNRHTYTGVQMGHRHGSPRSVASRARAYGSSFMSSRRGLRSSHRHMSMHRSREDHDHAEHANGSPESATDGMRRSRSRSVDSRSSTATIHGTGIGSIYTFNPDNIVNCSTDNIISNLEISGPLSNSDDAYYGSDEFFENEEFSTTDSETSCGDIESENETGSDWSGLYDGFINDGSSTPPCSDSEISVFYSAALEDREFHDQDSCSDRDNHAGDHPDHLDVDLDLDLDRGAGDKIYGLNCKHHLDREVAIDLDIATIEVLGLSKTITTPGPDNCNAYVNVMARQTPPVKRPPNQTKATTNPTNTSAVPSHTHVSYADGGQGIVRQGTPIPSHLKPPPASPRTVSDYMARAQAIPFKQPQWKIDLAERSRRELEALRNAREVRHQLTLATAAAPWQEHPQTEPSPLSPAHTNDSTATANKDTSASVESRNNPPPVVVRLEGSSSKSLNIRADSTSTGKVTESWKPPVKTSTSVESPPGLQLQRSHSSVDIPDCSTNQHGIYNSRRDYNRDDPIRSNRTHLPPNGPAAVEKAPNFSQSQHLSSTTSPRPPSAPQRTSDTAATSQTPRPRHAGKLSPVSQSSSSQDPPTRRPKNVALTTIVALSSTATGLTTEPLPRNTNRHRTTVDKTETDTRVQPATHSTAGTGNNDTPKRHTNHPFGYRPVARRAVINRPDRPKFTQPPVVSDTAQIVEKQEICGDPPEAIATDRSTDTRLDTINELGSDQKEQDQREIKTDQGCTGIDASTRSPDLDPREAMRHPQEAGIQPRPSLNSHMGQSGSNRAVQFEHYTPESFDQSTSSQRPKPIAPEHSAQSPKRRHSNAADPRQPPPDPRQPPLQPRGPVQNTRQIQAVSQLQAAGTDSERTRPIDDGPWDAQAPISTQTRQYAQLQRRPPETNNSQDRRQQEGILRSGVQQPGQPPPVPTFHSRSQETTRYPEQSSLHKSAMPGGAANVHPVAQDLSYRNSANDQKAWQNPPAAGQRPVQGGLNVDMGPIHSEIRWPQETRQPMGPAMEQYRQDSTRTNQQTTPSSHTVDNRGRPHEEEIQLTTPRRSPPQPFQPDQNRRGSGQRDVQYGRKGSDHIYQQPQQHQHGSGEGTQPLQQQPQLHRQQMFQPPPPPPPLHHRDQQQQQSIIEQQQRQLNVQQSPHFNGQAQQLPYNQPVQQSGNFQQNESREDVLNDPHSYPPQNNRQPPNYTHTSGYGTQQNNQYSTSNFTFEGNPLADNFDQTNRPPGSAYQPVASAPIIDSNAAPHGHQYRRTSPLSNSANAANMLSTSSSRPYAASGRGNAVDGSSSNRNFPRGDMGPPVGWPSRGVGTDGVQHVGNRTGYQVSLQRSSAPPTAGYAGDPQTRTHDRSSGTNRQDNGINQRKRRKTDMGIANRDSNSVLHQPHEQMRQPQAQTRETVLQYQGQRPSNEPPPAAQNTVIRNINQQLPAGMRAESCPYSNTPAYNVNAAITPDRTAAQFRTPNHTSIMHHPIPVAPIARQGDQMVPTLSPMPFAGQTTEIQTMNGERFGYDGQPIKQEGTRGVSVVTINDSDSDDGYPESKQDLARRARLKSARRPSDCDTKTLETRGVSAVLDEVDEEDQEYDDDDDSSEFDGRKNVARCYIQESRHKGDHQKVIFDTNDTNMVRSRYTPTADKGITPCEIRVLRPQCSKKPTPCLFVDGQPGGWVDEDVELLLFLAVHHRIEGTVKWISHESTSFGTRSIGWVTWEAYEYLEFAWPWDRSWDNDIAKLPRCLAIDCGNPPISVTFQSATTRDLSGFARKITRLRLDPGLQLQILRRNGPMAKADPWTWGYSTQLQPHEQANHTTGRIDYGLINPAAPATGDPSSARYRFSPGPAATATRSTVERVGRIHDHGHNRQQSSTGGQWPQVPARSETTMLGALPVIYGQASQMDSRDINGNTDERYHNRTGETAQFVRNPTENHPRLAHVHGRETFPPPPAHATMATPSGLSNAYHQLQNDHQARGQIARQHPPVPSSTQQYAPDYHDLRSPRQDARHANPYDQIPGEQLSQHAPRTLHTFNQSQGYAQEQPTRISQNGHRDQAMHRLLGAPSVLQPYGTTGFSNHSSNHVLPHEYDTRPRQAPDTIGYGNGTAQERQDLGRNIHSHAGASEPVHRTAYQSYDQQHPQGKQKSPVTTPHAMQPGGRNKEYMPNHTSIRMQQQYGQEQQQRLFAPLNGPLSNSGTDAVRQLQQIHGQGSQIQQRMLAPQMSYNDMHSNSNLNNTRVSTGPQSHGHGVDGNHSGRNNGQVRGAQYGYNNTTATDHAGHMMQTQRHGTDARQVPATSNIQHQSNGTSGDDFGGGHHDSSGRALLQPDPYVDMGLTRKDTGGKKKYNNREMGELMGIPQADVRGKKKDIRITFASKYNWFLREAFTKLDPDLIQPGLIQTLFIEFGLAHGWDHVKCRKILVSLCEDGGRNWRRLLRSKGILSPYVPPAKKIQPVTTRNSATGVSVGMQIHYPQHTTQSTSQLHGHGLRNEQQRVQSSNRRQDVSGNVNVNQQLGHGNNTAQSSQYRPLLQPPPGHDAGQRNDHIQVRTTSNQQGLGSGHGANAVGNLHGNAPAGNGVPQARLNSNPTRGHDQYEQPVLVQDRSRAPFNSRMAAATVTATVQRPVLADIQPGGINTEAVSNQQPCAPAYNTSRPARQEDTRSQFQDRHAGYPGHDQQHRHVHYPEQLQGQAGYRGDQAQEQPQDRINQQWAPRSSDNSLLDMVEEMGGLQGGYRDSNIQIRQQMNTADMNQHRPSVVQFDLRSNDVGASQLDPAAAVLLSSSNHTAGLSDGTHLGSMPSSPPARLYYNRPKVGASYVEPNNSMSLPVLHGTDDADPSYPNAVDRSGPRPLYLRGTSNSRPTMPQPVVPPDVEFRNNQHANWNYVPQAPVDATLANIGRQQNGHGKYGTHVLDGNGNQLVYYDTEDEDYAPDGEGADYDGDDMDEVEAYGSGLQDDLDTRDQQPRDRAYTGNTQFDDPARTMEGVELPPRNSYMADMATAAAGSSSTSRSYLSDRPDGAGYVQQKFGITNDNYGNDHESRGQTNGHAYGPDPRSDQRDISRVHGPAPGGYLATPPVQVSDASMASSGPHFSTYASAAGTGNGAYGHMSSRMPDSERREINMEYMVPPAGSTYNSGDNRPRQVQDGYPYDQQDHDNFVPNYEQAAPYDSSGRPNNSNIDIDTGIRIRDQREQPHIDDISGYNYSSRSSLLTPPATQLQVHMDNINPRNDILEERHDMINSNDRAYDQAARPDHVRLDRRMQVQPRPEQLQMHSDRDDVYNSRTDSSMPAALTQLSSSARHGYTYGPNTHSHIYPAEPILQGAWARNSPHLQYSGDLQHDPSVSASAGPTALLNGQRSSSSRSGQNMGYEPSGIATAAAWSSPFDHYRPDPAQAQYATQDDGYRKPVSISRARGSTPQMHYQSSPPNRAQHDLNRYSQQGLDLGIPQSQYPASQHVISQQPGGRPVQNAYADVDMARGALPDSQQAPVHLNPQVNQYYDGNGQQNTSRQAFPAHVSSDQDSIYSTIYVQQPEPKRRRTSPGRARAAEPESVTIPGAGTGAGNNGRNGKGSASRGGAATAGRGRGGGKGTGKARGGAHGGGTGAGKGKQGTNKGAKRVEPSAKGAGVGDKGKRLPRLGNSELESYFHMREDGPSTHSGGWDPRQTMHSGYH